MDSAPSILNIPSAPSATSGTSAPSVTFAEEERCVSFDESVEEQIVEEGVEPPAGWDEGGKSHCGYPDSIHETLMSIGGAMHSFFGEPTEEVQVKMQDVGNYFQEMSYAARDFKHGKLSVKDALPDDASSVDSAGSEVEAEPESPEKNFQTITTVPL